MKYLNIGCGSHYSSDFVWTNLDFTSTGKNVIAHNLLKGIPLSKSLIPIEGTYIIPSTQINYEFIKPYKKILY